MKSGSIVLCLLLSPLVSFGEEAAAEKSARSRRVIEVSKAPKAWLGLRLEKPGQTVTAHLPDLPAGMGFLVKSIDQGGPAQIAGLRELDIVWKLGDQMLVNEAQLAALLRLSKPGEEVTLAGFREGQPFEAKVVFGNVPVHQKTIAAAAVQTAESPDYCEMPQKLAHAAEKSASFSSDEGSARVWREGETFQVKVKGPDKEVIFEGPLSDEGTAPGLSEEWNLRTRILVRTLKQTLDGNVLPVRQPRPRVVPAAPSP